ncbi:MAG: DUF4332 domain-containing protein [Gemmatimonadota bacterium]|jgi:predicted flap endonuclease-1-like 5' DNA nuclease
MAKLSTIEGIGDVWAGKLEAAGIKSVATLLENGATAKGRRDLATRTGLREADILRWVNHADLMRVRGVGAEYSELLEAAGVDTVAELARRNRANLYVAMSAANTERKRVRQLPTEKQVGGWIDQARALPRVIEY